MSKFVLRVRQQRLGTAPVVTLWLLEDHGTARSGVMHGDMRSELAERVIELLAGKGVKVERDPVQQWDEGSEPTADERIATQLAKTGKKA